MSGYTQKYKECLGEILAKSISPDLPYSQVMDFVKNQLELSTLSENAKVNIISQILPQMAIQFTSIAMNAAIEVATREQTSEVELENLKRQGEVINANIAGIKEQTRGARIKNDTDEEQRPIKLENLKRQGELLAGQIAKLNKETTLSQTQQDAINAQVSDNRLIKAMGVLGDFIAGNQAGGMIVPPDMSRYFFDLIDATAKRSGAVGTKPSTYDMAKRT